MKKFDEMNEMEKTRTIMIFDNLMRNEQLKAKQAVQSYQKGEDFGGTSISALVTRADLCKAIDVRSYSDISQHIAESYIEQTKKILPSLSNAFSKEEMEIFEEHGIFYGLHISPKLLSLSEGLIVEHKDLLVNGFPEPYKLYEEDSTTITAYFNTLREERGIDIDMSSIILADTTGPKGYEGKKLLNPNNMNKKLSKLSNMVKEDLKKEGVIIDAPYIVSADTDSPHRLLMAEGKKPFEGYPLTPGLTMCGSTASMKNFDFKFAYRLGIISQTISNNIVASKISSTYSPFIFFGMLSPFGYKNGAIAPKEMGDVRYDGSINLKKELEYQMETTINKLM